MKSFLKIPYYLLIAAVMSTGLLLLATLVPIPGNFSVKIVKSGSMEPAIQTGGIIVIRRSQNYGVGDVITFGKDTKTQIPTTHRIVEVQNSPDKYFITRGDANDAIDPSPVRESEVRGKVVFDIPYVGFVLDFAKKPLGFVLLVGIPALLVIIDEISKIWREIKKMRQRKPDIYEKIRQNNNILDLRVVRNMEKTGLYGSKFVVVFAIALTFGILGWISRIGSTVSYYNEKEAAVQNTLQARAVYPSTEPEVRSASIENVLENTEEEIVTEGIQTESRETEPEEKEVVIPEEQKETEEIKLNESSPTEIETELEQEAEPEREQEPPMVEEAEPEPPAPIDSE